MNAIVDLQNLQKRFNLFAEGDIVKGTVFAINKDRTEVITVGGCLGFVNRVYQNIKVGSSVEVCIDKIEDGVLSFQFTDDFLFFSVPQAGEVMFSGTLGTVVKFQNGRIGYFSAEHETSEHLHNLPAGQRVVCRCRSGEPDYCLIDSVDIAGEDDEPPLTEEENPASVTEEEDSLFWPEEEKQKALNDGSFPKMGKLILGFCYQAKVYKKETGIVVLVDGSKAQVVGNRPCPQINGTEIFVRLVGIRAHGRLFVEVLNLPEKEQETVKRIMEREFYVSAQFNFYCSDKEVYTAGIRNNSERFYGRYKLGMLYSMNIVNGKPDFEAPGEVEIETEVDANGFTFKENDIVFVRITHITLDMETKFKVRVENVITA